MPTITINGVKHTPGSNTLKRMKRKAAAEAAAKKDASASKPKSKKKKVAKKETPPVPRARGDRPKAKEPVKGLRIPQGPTNVLKGKPKAKKGGGEASSNVENRSKRKPYQKNPGKPGSLFYNW